MARVMIVDDSALFRDALCSLLVAANIEIVGMAANGVQAVGQASELQPDLILMDVRMPEMSGIEAARIVKASHPNIKIVMLSGVDDGRTLSLAMSLGVDGFISRDSPGEELINEVNVALGGGTALSPRLADRVIASARADGKTGRRDPSQLTGRELEVIAGVASGKTNFEIAEVLCLSPSTVKSHLSNVLSKLGLRNRVEAAAYAIENGLADAPGAPDRIEPAGNRSGFDPIGHFAPDVIPPDAAG